MKEFSEIYAWRSKVVHTGKLPNKTKKTPFTHEEVQQFIEKSSGLMPGINNEDSGRWRIS